MHFVQLGDRVRIQYRRVRQFAAPGPQPARRAVEFSAGTSNMIPTLSWGVVGMAQGECKQFTLQPGEAFGVVLPELIRELPRCRVRRGVQLHVGQTLTAVQRISGRRRRVRVVELTPYSVVIDGNHPLAGKQVVLEIVLISIDHSAAANAGQPQFDLGGES